MDDISAASDTMNGDLHEGGEHSIRNSKKRKLEPLMQHFPPFETVEDVGETFIKREENGLTPPQVSSLSSRAIHRRQAEFWGRYLLQEFWCIRFFGDFSTPAHSCMCNCPIKNLRLHVGFQKIVKLEYQGGVGMEPSVIFPESTYALLMVPSVIPMAN